VHDAETLPVAEREDLADLPVRDGGDEGCRDVRFGARQDEEVLEAVGCRPARRMRSCDVETAGRVGVIFGQSPGVRPNRPLFGPVASRFRS
jgi:hypothetical protein